MVEKDLLIAHWPVVRKNLMTLIDGFDEGDLTFVPVNGGWSVGEIMLHIGDTAEYWLHSGVLSEINISKEDRATLKNFPTKSAITGYLAAEHAMTMALLEHFDNARWNTYVTHHDERQYTPAWMFWHVLEHEIHHRGELSLITGILGREGLDV